MLRQKGLVTALLCLNAALTVILIIVTFAANQAEPAVQPEPEPLTEIANDILLASLEEAARLVLTGYYRDADSRQLALTPADMEIMELKRLGQGRSLNFLVKIKAAPRLGAHNLLGEDQLTFEINHGSIRVTEYEHMKDFPQAELPPQF
ncbi:MAG: DUF3888 domain-containing protein [Firmicutes bacterium]|nr:DUF3888 domain-containing protein [Bacillota bacterium]